MPYKKLGEDEYESLNTQTQEFNKIHKSENGLLYRNFFKDVKHIKQNSPRFTDFSPREKKKLFKLLKKRNSAIPDWKKEELTGRFYCKRPVFISPIKTDRP